MRKSYGASLVVAPGAAFWSHVKFGPGCWEWQSTKKLGYGYFCTKSKVTSAHRWIYFHQNPGGDRSLDVCHKCDNPSCVRPDHLFLGTAKDNVRDAISKGRFNAGIHEKSKTHCRNGHPYEAGNIYFWKRKRACRICKLASVKRYQERKNNG